MKAFQETVKYAKREHETKESRNMTPEFNLTFENTTNETRASGTFNNIARQTFHVVVFVVSLIGNFLVIVVVYRNVNKKMRTTTNLFVVNMAVSDLLTTVLPLTMYMAIDAKGQWPIHHESIVGLVLCKIVFGTWFLSSGVSLLSLVAIALDRFWAVFFPTKRPLTTRRPVAVLLAIWLVSTICQLPYFVESRVFRIDEQIICIPLLVGSYAVYYHPVHFSLFMAIPIVTTFTLYPALLIKLWRRQIPGNPSAANQELRDRTNCKVTIMAISLMVSCIVSWFPLIVEGILHLYNNAGSTLTNAPRFVFVTFTLTYTSCALNPIICLILNEHFRTGFRAILRHSVVQPVTSVCSENVLRK